MWTKIKNSFKKLMNRILIASNPNAEKEAIQLINAELRKIPFSQHEEAIDFMIKQMSESIIFSGVDFKKIRKKILV